MRYALVGRRWNAAAKAKKKARKLFIRVARAATEEMQARPKGKWK